MPSIQKPASPITAMMSGVITTLRGSHTQSTTRRCGRAKEIEINAPHTLSQCQISARREPEHLVGMSPGLGGPSLRCRGDRRKFPRPTPGPPPAHPRPIVVSLTRIASAAGGIGATSSQSSLKVVKTRPSVYAVPCDRRRPMSSSSGVDAGLPGSRQASAEQELLATVAHTFPELTRP
jgi:hypothetical protein